MLIPVITTKNPNIVCYRNEISSHKIERGDYIVSNWSYIGEFPKDVNFTNGIIDCNSSVISNITKITIVAKNDKGNGTLDITIMVDIGELKSFNYEKKEMIFPFGFESSFNEPKISGEYSGFEINKLLPAGIEINQTDGHFYGVPTVESNKDSYVVKIINPRKNLTQTVTISSQSIFIKLKIEFFCKRNESNGFVYEETLAGQNFTLPCKEDEDGYHNRYCNYSEANVNASWNEPDITCSKIYFY